MNPQLLTAGITILGFIVNGVWTFFNLRMEGKVLHHVDALKEWVREEYYDRTYIDAVLPCRRNPPTCPADFVDPVHVK